MGIYDREYYGQEQGMRLRGPSSVVGWLIAINVVLWLADGLLFPHQHTLTNILTLKGDTLTQPWLWWKYLTYGFAHAPFDSQAGIWHILGNMIGLFFFGRAIEYRYGAREFLVFYLVSVVVCGLVWSLIGLATHQPPNSGVLGASGAITAVVVLFIFLYPKQTVLLFFVIPMPAWVLGVLLVVSNLGGAAGYLDDDIAYTVHLAGAAFAVLYYKFKWRLSSPFTNMSFSNPLKRQPKLRIHDPDSDDFDSGSDASKMDKLAEEEDRILEKIHRQGVESLTRKERKILEKRSRHYKERNR